MGIPARFRVGCRQDDPPKGGRVVPLTKVKGSTRFSCWILSIKWEGFNHHWLNGRTVPHRADRKLCDGCLAKTKLKWSGFIQYYNINKNGTGFIEVTRDGTEVLLALQGTRGTLRGMGVHVFRQGNRDFGPLVFERMQDWDPNEKLPLPVSVEPTLMRLWGVDSLD
jgi:hypothetical protein